MDPFSNSGSQMITIMNGPWVVGMCTAAVVFCGLGYAFTEAGGRGHSLFTKAFGIAAALEAGVIVTWLHRFLG